MSQILLVDDDKVQSLTRKVILKQTGHDVVVANGAYSALRMLKNEEFAQSLLMVVTDHLMPEINGPDLVRELRRAKPTLPVLVLSGLPAAENEYAGLEVTFRLKPFPPEELIALVQQLVGSPARRTA